ncbi:MAG: hypothetical protein ACHBN1_14485 [Heteroscytonema crispum UTEX LB 1556]
MSQSHRSLNWKLGLTSLVMIGGAIASFADCVFAENIKPVQSVSSSCSSSQSASVSAKGDQLISPGGYQLHLADLISSPTASSPVPDKVVVRLQGQTVSPDITVNPGMNPGDNVQLNTNTCFHNAINVELYRVNNDGNLDLLDTKLVNQCNSSPPPLEFQDLSEIRYTLNYQCYRGD